MSESTSSPSRGFAGFLSGLNVAFIGLRFMLTRPRLWAYAWQPVIANILVTIFVAVAAYWGGREALGMLSLDPAASWGMWLLYWVAFFGIALLGIGLTVTAYVTLQGVFCAIFFSILARETELLLGTPASEMCDPPLAAQIADALRAGLKLLIANALLLSLHLVPLVGSVAAVTLGLYVDASVLGAEFLGYSLELRSVRWVQRQQYAKQHRMTTLGLGTVISLFLFVPVLGSVLQATAVVGSVLLYHRWQKPVH